MTTADTKQSSELRVEVQQILSAQQQPTITILSSLLAVQDSIHYLPEEAIKQMKSGAWRLSTPISGLHRQAKEPWTCVGVQPVTYWGLKAYLSQSIWH